MKMQEITAEQEQLNHHPQPNSICEDEPILHEQQNETEQDVLSLDQERNLTEEAEPSPQAQQGQTETAQITGSAKQNAAERKELTFEQKDFICKQLAAFKSYKEVAGLFIVQFSDSGFTFEQVLKRIKYYACDNRTRKWRFRIQAYRSQLNHNLANRFRLANKYERLRQLEAMFLEAMQPRVKRLFWYPARRRNDDKIIYHAVKVKERDLATAAKILRQIAGELDYDCLKPLQDPYMIERRYQDPKAFAKELGAFEKSDPEASRDLDKSFGLI